MGQEPTRSGAPRPEALLRQRPGRRASGAAGAAQDLSRLRLRRRQVVPDARRSAAAARARRGRRGRRAAAGRHAADVAAAAQRLEAIPTIDVAGGPSSTSPPSCAAGRGVCVVDGLAYDNPPGSRHPSATRTSRRSSTPASPSSRRSTWSSSPSNRSSSRASPAPRPASTVPQALHRRRRRSGHRRRTAGGATEAAASPALAQPARQLSQLRERALLLTADVVDRQLEAYSSCTASAHLGHAGTHPRLHDAARQRRRDAGERPAQCRSLPRRAARRLRQPAAT